MSSGRVAVTATRLSGAPATVTSPAPTRNAASPASRSAPGMPAPPPMTSTRPWVPLCDSRARRGRLDASSLSSMRRMSGANCGETGATTPRSSSSTTPACSGPAPRNSPDFSATKLTVTSAHTAASVHRAGVGIHSGWDVERQHRTLRGIDRADHGERLRRAARPRARCLTIRRR